MYFADPTWLENGPLPRSCSPKSRPRVQGMSGLGDSTCYAYGSDQSCLSWTPDGGQTIFGCGTDTTGYCAPSGNASLSVPSTTVAGIPIWGAAVAVGLILAISVLER